MSDSDLEPSSSTSFSTDDSNTSQKNNTVSTKLNKKIRPKKKKKKKKRTCQQEVENVHTNDVSPSNDEPKPEIEYIQEVLTVKDLEPQYRQYAKVFEHFKLDDEKKTDEDIVSKQLQAANAAADISTNISKKGDIQDEEDKTEEIEVSTISKRKMKKLTRLSVVELKQLVDKPSVVEMEDVNSRDPKLLVELKAYRNSVPVPRHWCFKRKYLQGKRGFEKGPFELPAFIKSTGITEMRDIIQAKEDSKSLKAKMKDRVRPKLGKIDIDYQKLHDAFFKYQTKPRLSIHGDLYFEGKEFETKQKDQRPGALSDDLKIALGIPIAQDNIPPPWLIAMQRYGPPPSYPNLKIPGLNAPIPEGCTFGYHAGGWGKPPVDRTGKPLYGDVFNTTKTVEGDYDPYEKGLWGELESESEHEQSDKEEEEDDNEEKTGFDTPVVEGLITPSGIESVEFNFEEPDSIELRKSKIESEMETRDIPNLYTILQERQTDGAGTSMMGSTHVYDMTGAGGQIPPSVLAARRSSAASSSEEKPKEREAIELNLDPSELDLNSEIMASRYEETMRNRRNLNREELSEMVQDHVLKQKNKRKRQTDHESTKPSKKYKEFKF